MILGFFWGLSPHLSRYSGNIPRHSGTVAAGLIPPYWIAQIQKLQNLLPNPIFTIRSQIMMFQNIPSKINFGSYTHMNSVL